jgi:hypothetical protein
MQLIYCVSLMESGDEYFRTPTVLTFYFLEISYRNKLAVFFLHYFRTLKQVALAVLLYCSCTRLPRCRYYLCESKQHEHDSQCTLMRSFRICTPLPNIFQVFKS